MTSNFARSLDERLFTPGPWLAIDAANVEVKGTRTVTLDQALALIGHGRVASVVGRLRPEVVGVDVDSDVFAGDIVDTLTAFCRANGLWHLVRPSGGAPGRAHLFLIPGRHRAALDELVLRLRAELGVKANPGTGRRAKPLGRKHVDVRSQLRPLSAPHRCQPTPTLDRDVLAAALTDLEEVRAHLPTRPTEDRDSDRDPARGTRRDHRGPTRAGIRASDGLLEARTPLPRPRRDLPAGWAAYLRQGRKAAAAAGLDREPGSRSTIEYDATRALVLAGLDEAAAWAAIDSAHRSAFPKARANGRRWWWHVWNAAVDKADEWLAARRAELTQHPALAVGDEAVAEAGSTRADVAGALSRAYAELDAVWRSWPAQTRHTRRELMRCVLERMTRRGCTSVALPQRDALQDCAVQSRNTIAAARDDLVAAGLLDVTSTHVRGTTDTADTWSLPARFLTDQETSTTATTVPSAKPVTGEHAETGRGVGHFEPSRATPPRAALPLRRTLGLPRTHLLEALLTHADPRPLAELAADAGLLTPSFVRSGTSLPSASGSTASTTAEPGRDDVLLSKDQHRTVRAHLHALASLGLAVVDADGAWAATPAARASTTSLSAALVNDRNNTNVLDNADVTRLHRRGQDRQAAVTAAVTAERTEFRARLDPTARRHRWLAQRQDALARQAKLDVARRKAWWDGLDPVTRHQRRATAVEQFAALAPHEQAQRKHNLALARARAGLNERQRHEAWWASLSPDERDQRSIVRAWAFHAQPEQLRAEQVAAWTAHRTRWDLPHRPHRAEANPAAAAQQAGSSGPPPPVIDLTASERAEELQLVSVL